MIVVAIIGLLAGIGVPAILKSVQNSRIKQAETELSMMSAAILQLVWDTGYWPNGKKRHEAGSAEMWDISVARCGLMSTDGTHDDKYGEWKGPYYEGEINDPWGNPYFFDPDYSHREKDGTVRNAVVVGSFGPNGVGQNKYDSDDIYVLLDD